MSQFIKKRITVEATQWFKNGDHLHEGAVVQYYRTPDLGGQNPCLVCNRTMGVHGWIDTLEGGHIVCPGDWIITGVQNEKYPCKPAIFEQTYEAVQ